MNRNYYASVGGSVNTSKTGWDAHLNGNWGMKAALLAIVVLTMAGTALHFAGAGSNGLAKASGPNSAAHSAHSSTSLSLPLFFEPNQGQTDSRVKFLARGAGYGLFLTGDEAVLSLQQTSRVETRLAASKAGTQKPTASVIRMRLDGTNSTTNIHGTQPLPGKSNYFIGNDPSKWHRGIPQFGGVEYQSVYPGIDLVYYGNQQQLEYDFRVAPGADPNQIALTFKGASAHLDSGDLVLSTAGGDVRFRAPHIYQPGTVVESAKTEGANTGRNEKAIAGSFRQLAGNRIGFTVGPYDHSRELVIDPILSYSTFLGGGGEVCPTAGATPDQGCPQVAVDASNNIYVAGSTQSAAFPVTAGALQSSLAPGATQNIFIAVINTSATGLSQLLFATYLGGEGIDSLAGIGVDPIPSFPTINIYVAGTTTSTNFPITSSNAFQQSAAFGPNQTHGFLSTINVAPGSSGNTFTLKYSTFLAGNASNSNTTENDVVTGLAVDSSFNAYVTGTTTSTDVITGFPSTPNAFQICPFEPAQAGGNPCPVTTGPPQFFASKINTAGSGTASMLYSTYFGGGYTDDPKNVVVTGGGIAVDPSANNANNTNVNMYFTGTTNMPGGTGPNGEFGFPLFNSWQSCLNQSGVISGCVASTNTDAILVKLNPNLNQPNAPPVYSTYLGGSGTDNGIAVGVDTSSNAYVTGSTASNDWACNTGNTCILGPYQSYTGTNGHTNAYIAKVGNEGNVLFPLNFFTYIGGSGPDSGQAIAVDSIGTAHVAGSTQSADLPVVNPLQPPTSSYNGGVYGLNGDAFVALISTTPTSSGPFPGDYLSYLGGSGLDQGTGIALDVFDNAYVAGTTASSNFPTANALQGYNAPQNAFVSVLGATSKLVVSSGNGSPSPSPLPAGTQGTFTFNITNNGPDPASDVIFQANVPISGLASLPTASVSSGAGSCSQALGSTLVCTIGTLAVSAVAQVQVFVTPQSPAVGLAPQISVSGQAIANGTDVSNTWGQSAFITDFAIIASPSSQTVQNGQLATFNVAVSADYALGYNATVSLTQSSSPPMVTSPAPTFIINPVTVAGTTAAQTQLNIQTVARPVTTGGLFRRTSFYAAWLPIGGLSLIGLGVGASRKRRLVLAGIALGLVGGLLLLQPACGSSSNPTTTTGGTAAGQYTITITGSASTGASHQTIVTLNVT